MNDIIKKAASLFDKEEAKKLCEAVYDYEYVRVDFHIFNAGAYITCEYSNDPNYLLEMEGCAEHGIFDVVDLGRAILECAPEDVASYYMELTRGE